MQASSRFAVAVHLLALAQAEAAGGLVTSEAMAGSVRTNPVVVRRILGNLREAGLVVSQPGTHGGWRLARQPEAITLLDILRAVDGAPKLALHHHPPNDDCPVGREMCRVLARHFGDAEAAMEARLAQVTMADVLAGVFDTVDSACHTSHRPSALH